MKLRFVEIIQQLIVIKHTSLFVDSNQLSLETLRLQTFTVIFCDVGSQSLDTFLLLHQRFPWLDALLYQTFLVFLQIGSYFIVTFLQILFIQKPLRWSQRIVNWLCRAIIDGIYDAIFIQIILHFAVFILGAELTMCFRNWRTSKCKSFGVWQHCPEFHLIVTVFGAVRLVDKHNNIVAVVNDIAQFAKFLNGSDKHACRFVFDNRNQITDAQNDAGVWKLAIEKRVAHLVFQILAVNNDENGRIFERFGFAKFVGRIKHCERLARTLCMPNHTLSLWRGCNPVNNLVGCTKLLITRHFFNDFAIGTFKHDKMPQNVEHTFGLQQTDYAKLHLLQQLTIRQTLNIKMHQTIFFVFVNAAKIVVGMQQWIIVFIGNYRVFPFVEI